MDETSATPAGDTLDSPPAPPAAALAVSWSLEDGYPRFDVRGALTARTMPLLAAALDPLSQAAAGEVRVGLGQVSEFTVTAAATLLYLQRQLRRTGSRLVLCEPSVVVVRLLTDTGLAQHFRFAPPSQPVE